MAKFNALFFISAHFLEHSGTKQYNQELSSLINFIKYCDSTKIRIDDFPKGHFRIKRYMGFSIIGHPRQNSLIGFAVKPKT